MDIGGAYCYKGGMTPFPEKITSLHFVGIGGIGMSGLAEIALALDLSVQGSDQNDGANTQRLTRSGIRVMIGHKADNLKCADGSYPQAVIVSSAIKDGNPEVEAARALHIPVVKRADFLAQIMRLKWSIGIAGTHGKTTTTSLVGHILEEASLDPTVINGGIINALGTNVKLGKGGWMVVETDESDGSFKRMPITTGLITNIDPEHMEHYGDFDSLRAAFAQFVANVPFYGAAVLCIDHPEVASLMTKVKDVRTITYGFSPQANMRAVNVRNTPHNTIFDLHWQNGHEALITDVPLTLMGQHNVQNATGAAAIAYDMGVSPDIIKQALGNFQGVKRRFTKTGEVNGISIIDDYGHHPTEIRAVMRAARQALADNKTARVIAVVQPHRYTRLASLFEDFCTCLHDADHVYVADVYAAGEQPIEGFNRDSFVKGLHDAGHRSAEALSSPDDLPQLIRAQARPGDMVVFLGAGSVIIGMHHDQDIRNMGGLWKYMKITWITSLIGSLALIGTPFFSGFYSKDSIIEAVHASHLPAAHFAYFAVIVGVFVTAFYSFRMYFLVFHGKERFHHKPFPGEHDHHDEDDHGHGHAHTPHESPWVVTLPLILLAIPSALIGYFTIQPELFGEFLKSAVTVDATKHFAMTELREVFFHGAEHATGHEAWDMAIHGFTTLPFFLALAGVVTAFVFYIVAPQIPAMFAKVLRPLIVIGENKYFLDWFNEHILAAGARLLGRGLWKVGDVGIIDGLLVNGSAKLVGLIGSLTRLFQTGYLYHYALVMILGVFALMTWFVFMHH